MLQEAQFSAYETAEQIKTSPVTSRTPAFYKDVFNLNPAGLTGKNILDVGGGLSTFSRWASQYANFAISLDAQHSYQPEYKRVKNLKRPITGTAQDIPFADETFDQTLASWSLFWIEDVRESLKEMLRVTRSGGSIKVYPVGLRHLYPRSLPPGVSLAQISPTSEAYAGGDSSTMQIIKVNRTEEEWDHVLDIVCSQVAINRNQLYDSQKAVAKLSLVPNLKTGKIIIPFTYKKDKQKIFLNPSSYKEPALNH